MKTNIPDAAYIDTGVIKALLSERGATRPSEFETAARIFLQTIIGKYEPPEELPEDATDEERLKYRWGHQAMDIYRRRMKFEKKLVNPQKAQSGKRSQFAGQLMKSGKSREEAWKIAWAKYPRIETPTGDSRVESEATTHNETEAPENAPTTAPAVEEAPNSVPAAKAVTPVQDAELEELVPDTFAARKEKSDKAKIAEWNKKFPNADVLREYIISQVAHRLNSSNMEVIMKDPNAAVDVYHALVAAEWRSSKTKKVFTHLMEVIPWLIQNYRESIAAQKRADKRLTEKEFEMKMEDAAQLDHDDVETYRARRDAMAEQASKEWAKTHK